MMGEKHSKVAVSADIGDGKVKGKCSSKDEGHTIPIESVVG